MADLMATLDDMAQDLRDALEIIADVATEATANVPVSAGFREADREAAYLFLRERIQGLQHPIDVASLAWEMQREFSQDVANGWVGHGTFKELVLAAVPEVRLIPDPPGYVLPAGFSVVAESFKINLRPDKAVPRAAMLLHETDKSFPLVVTQQWLAAYQALAQATQQVRWDGSPTIATLKTS